MKFSLVAMALSLFASAFGQAFSDSSIGKEVVGDEFFDVSIIPKCAGVDMDSLSATEKAFVSDVLETTYNQVHSIFDGGDMYIFGIEASPASPELSDTLGRRRSPWFYWGGSGACNGFCAQPNDCIDDASGYAADDPSQLCSNNDSIMLVSKNTKTHADRMWEKRVTTKLKEGPYPVFHGIGKCEITMKSMEAGADPDTLKIDEREDVDENKKFVGLRATKDEIKNVAGAAQA